MSRHHKLLILLQVAAALVVACQAWAKPFPVWVYMAAAAVLGLTIGVSLLTQHHRRAFTFVQLVLLALLARNIYFLATHYSVIPRGDPYTEYALMRMYLEEGTASVVPPSVDFFTSKLSLYSGWPGVGLFGAAVARVTGVDPVHVAVALPFGMFLGWFGLAYCLLRRLERDLGLSSLATGLALVLMATSPFLYQPPGFYHQQLGLLFFMGITFLIYRQVTLRSPANSVLLMLVIGALVVVHHYTSLLVVGYLFLFSVLALACRYLGVRRPDGLFARAALPTFLTLGVIASAWLFVWWDSFAWVAWPMLDSRLDSFVEVLTTASFSAAQPPTWAFDVPPSLAPAWAPILLYLRDALTYIATLGGFVLLWRRRTNMPMRFFIILSLLVAAVPLTVDAFFGLSVGLVYRELYLFLPFIALCFGIFYQSVSTRWKPLSAGLLVGIITLLVFASLVGLWGHRYIPAHLYDPSVSWVEAGEHPTNWRRLESLFQDYMTYDDVDQILTDDWYPLSLIVPLDQGKKLQPVNFKKASLAGNTITVAFRDLSTASYLIQGAAGRYDPDFDEAEFREQLDTQSNLVLTNGEYRVWRGEE